MQSKNLRRLLGLVPVSFLTPGCTGADKAALEALKQETLNHLVFVEGGTFEMGDVGYTDKNG